MGHAYRGDMVVLLENEIIKENNVTIKCLVFQLRHTRLIYVKDYSLLINVLVYHHNHRQTLFFLFVEVCLIPEQPG